MQKKLWSLNEMERTGGEPDMVGQDKKSGEYIFFDCSAESPKGRTSFCYDREGLESRKEHRPKNTAIDMAAAMGIELLTEEQYFELQKLASSIRRRQAGLQHRLTYENSVARSMVIAATAASSWGTTARSLTMPPEVSAAR